MNDKPRVMTKEEVRDKFLNAVKNCVNYWMRIDDKTLEERMTGAVFSILVIIDGESELPGFELSPFPHPSDKKFYKDRGENWYPHDIDIAGELHHRFIEIMEE